MDFSELSECLDFGGDCTCIKLSLTRRKGRRQPCQSISWALAGLYLSSLETSSSLDYTSPVAEN